MKKRQYVIHPYLFAIYPAISLLAANLDQISPSVGLRATIVLLSVAVVFMLLFWFWMKDIKKAGLAVSWMMFLIFIFKPLASFLEGIWIDLWLDKNLALASITLLTIFALLIFLGPWFIWRFVKSSLDMLTTFLNVVAIIMVIFPFFQIGNYIVNTPDRIDAFETQSALAESNTTSYGELPDIYYIIVDGYGRSDVLQELYDFDNSDFLDGLTERGFYVADESTTNYMQTLLSLSSSLNFGYLDAIAASLGDELDRRDPLNYLVQQNQVRKILEEAGYQTIIYDSDLPIMETYSGVAKTAFGNSENKNLEGFGLNAFEGLLWRNTILNDFTPDNRSYDSHRNLIIQNLDDVKSASSAHGPKFVITHVISPHPPFVFAADGTHIQPDYDYSVQDGNDFNGTREEYISGYVAQTTHMNTLLLETVDHILKESKQPPIIIIQGDHGPGSTLNFAELEKNLCHKERQSILNAYYFPDGDYDELYESITPVNTFPVILNKILGSDIELAEDKNYFSLWNTPYDFVDVTDKLESCQLPAEN